MYEEQRLMAMGFPISDAVTLCHSMRREGALDSFMREQEKKITNNCNIYSLNVRKIQPESDT